MGFTSFTLFGSGSTLVAIMSHPVQRKMWGVAANLHLDDMVYTLPSTWNPFNDFVGFCSLYIIIHTLGSGASSPKYGLTASLPLFHFLSSPGTLLPACIFTWSWISPLVKVQSVLIPILCNYFTSDGRFWFKNRNRNQNWQDMCMESELALTRWNVICHQSQ